jgi:curved DNA-binding protein
MEYKDYYKVMGLKRDATPKDIKTAYRRLARKFHPDLNKETGAEEQFKDLGEAYEVLKDPEKRAIYDQYGQDRAHQQQSRASTADYDSDFSWGNASGNAPPFTEDFFESLFGARSRSHHTRATAGHDLHGSLAISLEEAYSGAVKEVQLPAMTGESEPRTLRVKIPAGVTSGQQLRLSGQGQAGHAGGSSGDLLLTIVVNKHPWFEVIGKDVYVTLPVAPWEVALGATVVVPTLGGKVDLKIAAGSQGGQTLRLKNRGMPGKVAGDHYVLLKVIIPQPKTETDRALYQKMADEMSFNPREKMEK